MYFELPDYRDFFRFTGSYRYRYVPVDITPQNFHCNRHNDSMLIVDNTELTAAVREEFERAYGKINILVPDYDVYESDFPRYPLLYIRLKKYFPDDEDYALVNIILTDEEFSALVRMRYPIESQRDDFISMAIDEWHEYTSSQVIYIKIDNPPPGLTELFEDGRNGS